jgi:hydroxymethylbilane synthase
MKLKVGTRGSALARTQSTTIANALTTLGHEVELVIIRTAGDDSTAPSFGSIGAQGVFVREIEQALLDGRVDVAVHSCKDLPTSSPDALALVAVPTRVDPADALIAKRSVDEPAAGLIPIMNNAVVGTASARRQSWLRALRPDLGIKPIRGNVPTRIAKLSDGYDAILLAAAGLERLKSTPLTDTPALTLEGLVVTRLHPRAFVPAPAQGALALQCRRDALAVVDTLAQLDDPISHACIAAERALLAHIEGGCDLALGAYCAAEGEHFEFIAMLERNGTVLTETVSGADPAALADRIWEALARR